MERDWASVDSYSFTALAEIKKALLISEGIQAIVINTQSSQHLVGDVDLYVHRDDVIQAKRILDEHTENE
jgi:hypothetical protein